MRAGRLIELVRWGVVLVGAALLACEARSAIPGGNHDALRYQLPDDYVEVIEGADWLEVLALEPTRSDSRSACGHPPRHGWTVAGRERVDDRATIREAARDVYTSILDGGAQALCFRPRLALAFHRGERSIELIVCEECLSTEIWSDGEVFTGPLRSSGFVASAVMASPRWRDWSERMRARCER